MVGPGPHGTPLKIREAIYDWMIRWLKDGDGSAAEQAVELLPEAPLWATKTGQVSEIAGSRDVYDVIRDDYERLRAPSTQEALLASLRRWMATPEDSPPTELATKLVLSSNVNGRKPAVILVATRPEAPKEAAKIAEQGNIVLIVWPRGLPATSDARRLSGNWIMDARASLVGLNLPALRAGDIVHAVDQLTAREDVDPKNIRAQADEIAGIWLLMAAAVDARISAVALRRTPYSFRAALENPLNRDLHDAAIPGFALHWDLEDLVRAIQPRTVVWTDPTDWMRRVVPLAGPYRYSPVGE